MSRRVLGLIAIALPTLSAGCATVETDPSGAATKPALATDVDPATAEPAYWLAKEPTLSVTGSDFDRMWDAAIGVSSDYLFPIDRRDRRAGLLTTVPTVSAQWFEPWRRELQTVDDVAASSVATIRRTIFWNFTREGERYTVVPKVLVERESFREQRISGLLSRAYFRRDPKDPVYGNKETDRNLILPDSYFYPVGRDFAFEQRLVEKFNARLAAVASR